jgi:hypothetical protein
MKITVFLFVLCLVVVQSSRGFCEQLDKDGYEIAMDGYDAVSYYLTGTPQKGYSIHHYVWRNLMWYFASDENKKLFISEPDTYAPRYFGYCSRAVCNGYKKGSDPKVWVIVDGKLYLFSSEQNKDNWLQHATDNIVKANQNWRHLH